MKFIRTAVLIVLSLGIVVSGVMMQIAISAESTILNTDFYTSFVENHNLNNIPQNYVLLKIKENTCQLDDHTYKSLIDATCSTFSEDWTQDQVSGLVNNLLSYLKHSSDELDLRIDFREKKSQFKSELLSNLNSQAAVPSNSMISVIDLTEHLSESFGIPDYIDLQYSSYLNDTCIIEYINTIRTFFPYSRYLPYLLFLLLFLILFFLSNLSKNLKITGRSISASGLILIILVSYVNGVLDNCIPDSLSSYDEFLALTGNNPAILATIFKNTVMAAANKVGIIFCLSGIVLYTSGYFMGKNKNTSNNLYA